MTTATAPGGIEVMREFLPNSPFVSHLGIELTAISDGRAELTMPFRAELTTIADVVHGGAIATLIDGIGTEERGLSTQLPWLGPLTQQEGPTMEHSPTPAERSYAEAGDDGRLLADAISLNVILSAVSGLVLLFGGFALHDLFGLDAWILAVLGAGLVLFASSMVWLLAQPQHLMSGARLVLAADAAWIAGAAVLLLAYPTTLAPAGRVTLSAVTVAVAGLVVLQALGLRRAGGRPVTGANPIGFHFERLVAASVDEVWRAVSDAGNYARYAPGIAATDIVAGHGHGMVRVCTDDRGGRWAERCTAWDEGRRYQMTVDVGSYPRYYRLLMHDFAQTWELEPASGGTRLTLSFDGAVKLGVFGRLASRLFGGSRRFEAIVDAYEHELTSAGRTA